MPIVTFWSNNEKTIGQTVSAAAAATIMAMEHNYKVLLISVDAQNDSMENCFGALQSNKEILKTILSGPQISLDTGINGLLKVAQSNRVSPEIIKDYTKIIYKNRLEVLYSSTNKEMPVEEQIEYFKMIIKEYKIIWNICKYDKNSKYNTKNLTRTVWKKQTVYNVPYNTLLFEATSEGTLAELLLRIRTLKNEDENSQLFKEVKNLTEGILLRYQEIRMRM